MQVMDRLTLAAYGMHVADQIALVMVPLVAALAFQASPETIGVLVACQAMAHLLGSIPAGLCVDRVQARTVTIAATAVSLIGFSAAALSVYAESLTLFAVTVLLSGFGIVLFVLVALSTIPMVVTAKGFARANSRLEIPRAVSAFAVPLLAAALLDEENSHLVFAAAALCSLGALAVTMGLPRLPEPPRKKEPLLRMILEGGRLVVRHPLLRPIALCAIAWNWAFSALLVLIVPLILDYYQADPGSFGVALSAFGGGTIAGSWIAGRFSDRLSPNGILLFGPGISLVAVLMVTAIPERGAIEVLYGAFFLIGFGPSMWLIAQNSIRQLVTPTPMLGRVNAVIQTAIYGMRPLGALMGGVIAGAMSPSAGLAVVAFAFALSFAAALFSPLRSVRDYALLSCANTR